MKNKDALETKVEKRLNEIRDVPARNPQAALRARVDFLDRAVSASESRRHKGWILKSRKERFAMNAILATLMLAGLLFGGGATVNAAQDDLPNEPLYGLKVWSEDVGLQFQNNEETKVNRLMELTQVRVQEMTQLAENGEPIPDQVRLRLEQHIHQALQACLTMDGPSLDRALLQIRNRLNDQSRDMERLQLYLQEQLQLQTQDQLQLQTQEQLKLFTQTRTMLREQVRLVDEGLLNHETFRNRVQNGFQFGQENLLTPTPQNGNRQQNGQPTVVPGNPNNPGGPNTDPGGPNTDPGGNNNDTGSGMGGNGPGPGGGGSNNNGSGGNGK